MLKATLAAALACVIAGPAFAQNVNANNLVNVNVSNVANNLAQNLSVNVQDVIDLGSVQVPIGIAANVCGVAANVLASQNQGGTAECTATTSSEALTQIVGRQLTQP